jgi:sulfite oxidase
MEPPNMISPTPIRPRPNPFTRRSFLGGVTASALLAGPLGAWSQDKPREIAKQLEYHTEVPANAEPALADLVKDWITPTKFFYVRSHAPVPQIDLGAYRLTIEGLVERPLSITLAELQSLADTEVVATLTCAGNRRTEHSQVKQIDGVPWQAGAIGNAHWHGVRLSKLLQRAGLKPAARHIWFEGLDQIPKGEETIAFGGSIPVQKALLDTEQMPGALIATGMNGEPLPPDHGFPARAVVPGYIGARSVKWLGKIVVSDRTSPNHYLQDAYKLITTGDKLELAEAPPLYQFPVNSAIATPAAGATVPLGQMTVTGYALPQGAPGSIVRRVEVSTDGGRHWRAARLLGAAVPYCWRLWEAQIAVEDTTRQIVARAIDSHGNQQAATVDWNMKGYMFNAWHRVAVTPAE